MDSFQVFQIPEECFEPVNILNDDGNPIFTVTFLGVTEVDGLFRWSYQIDNVDAPSALSNWVLQIADCEASLVPPCLATAPFPTNTPPGELVEFLGTCEIPSDNENFPCPCTDAPCSGVITGLKFDELSNYEQELEQGFSQIYAFNLNQELPSRIGCFQLKFGDDSRCGQICVPDCSAAIECPDQCDCEDDVTDFSCEVFFDNPCFIPDFDISVDDILYGFCIDDVEPSSEVCTVPAQINVCGQLLTCCVEVDRFSQAVTISIQFNIPKVVNPDQGGCFQTTPLYECCSDTITASQSCFACPEDSSSPLEPATCENVEIIITGVEQITNNEGIPGVRINYTVDLPDCKGNGTPV